MAALSAASNARMANSRGGTNSGSFIGGIPPGMQHGVSHDPHMSGSGSHAMPGPQPPNPSSFLDANMSAPNSAAPRPNLQIQQRYQGFLVGLANIMVKRNTPLPPQITGVPTPQYDPHTSAFKSIELSPEVGHFRLGGRDIDVFKLWGSIASSGGSRVSKCCSPAFPPPHQLFRCVIGKTSPVNLVSQKSYHCLMARRATRQVFALFRRVMILYLVLLRNCIKGTSRSNRRKRNCLRNSPWFNRLAPQIDLPQTQ